MPRKSRNTKQKELIDKEITNTRGFFTAEDIHEKVNVGLATIYRHVKRLREEKKLHAYMCDGRMLYSKNKKSHCHFICEETGKVIHFDVDTLDFLKNKIPGDISSFQIEVRGVCKKCKE